MLRLQGDVKAATPLIGAGGSSSGDGLTIGGSAGGEGPFAGKRQFDMILTDVIMPVMDGLDATRAIRKLETQYALPPIPIVALTANAMSHDRQKCAAAGMNFFVSKPFLKKDLFNVIDRAFTRVGGGRDKVRKRSEVRDSIHIAVR
jgi:CheY-like chemotaxis protein